MPAFLRSSSFSPILSPLFTPTAMGKERKNATRHTEVARGIPRYGRKQTAKKGGRYLFVKKGQTQANKPEEPMVVKKITGDKQSGSRYIAKKTARYYPADDIATPLERRHGKNKTTQLKKGIEAGSVLILLSGQYRGRRVVFLKQLDSGLLLVTGPFKVNGVPLRRVNQAYTIVTSTTVDVSGVDVSAVNDEMFAKPVAKISVDPETGIYQKAETKTELSEERKTLQANVDAKILNGLDKDVKAYLGAKFSLKKGQYPHNLKF
eukprot:TRINITY_DN119_c0_g2_i1.p1 TRINITY_DN119_c0_g2~~TRINITY_DN119_c0_g2_i1.p1  ORF type:complete len:263 (-),score=81.51 TRINITY_DN119_c0_g2_i1:100-888(-)